MYRENPSFKKPDNENVKIWRYIDFTKLVWMLEKESLFFTRIDIMQSIDPYEGSFYKHPAFALLEKGVDASDNKALKKFFRQSALKFKLKQKASKTVAVNCWHINEHESMAMWKLYLKSDEGVAIESTFMDLTQSFNNYQEDVFIGEVKYREPSEDVPVNVFEGVMYKHASYKHEQELRALIHGSHLNDKKRDWKANIVIGTPPGSIIPIAGIEIPVNLIRLVKKIHISPSSPSWFIDLVEAIIKKYDFDFPVVKSSLLRGP
jgi:hypothetical protein